MVWTESSKYELNIGKNEPQVCDVNIIIEICKMRDEMYEQRWFVSKDM